jgi:Uma2 family endonuclease
MPKALPSQKLLEVKEFLQQKPDGNKYELYNGVTVEMAQPIGKHENVTGFLTVQIGVEFTKESLPYNIPKTALVAFSNEEYSFAYSPDVLVLNRPNLIYEELWEKYSTVQLPQSIPLVIEVVSTNWRDDYHSKFSIYEEMGISEYWIVDYAGLGGRKFIGNPKQPTVFVCELVEGEYQMNEFRGNDLIQSLVFPNLKLTAQQIFDSAF